VAIQAVEVETVIQAVLAVLGVMAVVEREFIALAHWL
jgi:hypothetical protein